MSKKYIFAQTIFTHFLGQYPKKRKIPPVAGREKKSQQNSAGFFVWVTIKER